AILHHALESGINHLDTADLYAFGENENIVGDIIKQKRDDIILTTKVGNHFDAEKGSWFWDPSKRYIETAIDASLKRLKTDYIDLYLLHGGTIEDPIDDTIEAFENLKQAGKIKAYGISSIRPNVIRKYIEKSNIDAIMMQYSILDTRPEELLNLINRNNISVLARGPLAKGMLTTRATQYAAKKGSGGYLAYDDQELRKTINLLLQEDEPIARLAFGYVLGHPAVASTVFGASSLDQLKENVMHMDAFPLDKEKIERIKHIAKTFQYELHR